MDHSYHYQGSIIQGELSVPGDKSMSHRAILFASLAEGKSTIYNLLKSEDCRRTIDVCQAFGVDIQFDGHKTYITSSGIDHWQSVTNTLDLGNSGTTTRLLSGILASLNQSIRLTGDDSLQHRPMKRVTGPLSLMGAGFEFESVSDRLPYTVSGGDLTPIEYELLVASAQVKSAILLAGLRTKGKTIVQEPIKTRDHTENMISAFGGEIETNGQTVSVTGQQTLKPTDLTIPGDPSSAAFWIAAAVMTPQSDITIQQVSLNETRIGFIHVLQRMGADIQMTVDYWIGDEPVGHVRARSSSLKPTVLKDDEIPSLIDEVPLLALVATQCDSDMTLSGIGELKYKETDRIHATVELLHSIGVQAEKYEDAMTIKGQARIKGGAVTTYNDHRLAMLGVIASFVSENPIEIDNIECINISYPSFFADLSQILQDSERVK
ncbi:3-phosphoshikimate 1-carboxyvinyltransferase [Alkalibacillus flavidus]|uniref:3-phosphoshikimate 1-carboxyvinyltransferase n=1 Tax=Alkalibacillus flavidus TaxID=546021 RepID=A0ABV2KRW8_9BACI